MQNLGLQYGMSVDANNVKISILTTVEFVEKENIKLLCYLVLLGNDSSIGPKRLIIIHSTSKEMAIGNKSYQ